MRTNQTLRGAVLAAIVGAFVAFSPNQAKAVAITIDPGPAGSSMAAGTVFNLPGLAGSVIDGSVTLDIFFADGKYLDFSSLGVFNLILDLDFSNDSGNFATSFGGLLDVNGDPIAGALIGTITNDTLRTLNQFGSGFDPLLFGIRFNFSLNGADPGTTLTGATLNFFDGPIPIGQSVSVSEPATLALLGGGLLLAVASLRRSRRHQAA